MASISEIVYEVEFPRIGPLSGTPEEDRLIELWQWSILTQVYARLAVNSRHFNTKILQADVQAIWDKALAYVEEKKGGDAEIIELFPFMVDHAIQLIENVGQPSALDDPIELTDEERAQIEVWVQRGIYYTLWKRLEDRTPASDAISRVRVWIEGKITRDFSAEALKDLRFLIAVGLSTMKSIMAGTLELKILKEE